MVRTKVGQKLKLPVAAFLECGEIREILWAAHRSLVSDQRVFAKDKDRNAFEHCGDFTAERFIRRDATDARQETDPARGSSELNNLLGRQEVSFLNPN